MKMYRVARGDNQIEEVEVLRKTAQQVVFKREAARKETREFLRGQWANWFDSAAEAHQWMIEKAEKEVEWAKMALQKARTNLGMVQSIQLP